MIIETNVSLKNKTTKRCTYCGEEKSFLMMRPEAISYKGSVTVSVNKTKEPLWICLECFSMDLDALGCSVDIYEYDE